VGRAGVGIFANGNPDTATWNGIATGTGHALRRRTARLLAQLPKALSVLVVVGGLSYVFFQISGGPQLLRVSAADELAGLDLPKWARKAIQNGSLLRMAGQPLHTGNEPYPGGG